MVQVTNYRSKDVQIRRIDTLIGFIKGITADGEVNEKEAEILRTWFMQNDYTNNSVILDLYNNLEPILNGDSFTPQELVEILVPLENFTGEKSEPGELAKTATSPICVPPPIVEFVDKLFLFTGKFSYGSRSECKTLIESLGGRSLTSVTQKLNYLVLGEYATESWKHENFGQKIEKAMEYRKAGLPIAIITEEHWTLSVLNVVK